MQKGRFPSKIALLWQKVWYKVSLCENRQRQSCKVFIGYTYPRKMICGGLPLLRENWPKLAHPFQNANFQSIFARSDSAVTLSETSSIIANKTSTTRFPTSLNSVPCPKPPPPKKKGLKKRKMDVFPH